MLKDLITGPDPESENSHSSHGASYHSHYYNGEEDYTDRKNRLKIEELKKRIDEQDLQIDTQYNQIRQLNSMLITERNSVAKIKESANKMVQNMENKELFVGPQQEDGVLMGKFREVFIQVKTWSSQFTNRGDIDTTGLPAQVLVDFQKVAPNCSDFVKLLANRTDRRLFVQGLVGLALVEKVFCSSQHCDHPGKDFWMGKDISQSVCLIENRLFSASEF